MSGLLKIDSSLPAENDEKFTRYSSEFNTATNQNILMCSLKFVKDSHRFDNSLF